RVGRGRESGGVTVAAGGPLGKNRVVLFPPPLREALPPAFEQAVDVLVAEVPAPVALAQAPAERAHVADLRAGDLPRRGRERREGAERAVFGDLRQAYTSADRHALWDRPLRPHLHGDLAERPAQATET